MNKSIHQHNIGTIPVIFDTEIYDNSGHYDKSNIISYKTRRPLVQRNIFDYSMKYQNKDIYLLQEVQDGPDDINKYIKLNDTLYFYSYTKTGHLYYTDENEIPYDEKIYHGCVVAFNAEKYELISAIDIDIDNPRKRRSKFIIFSDSNKIYAALSVHGEIISEFSDKFYTRLNNFYSRLINAITNINEYYDYNVEYIIGGDFNINLFRPNFNPFNTIIQNTHFLSNVYKFTNVINYFLKFLNDNGIYALENPYYTNYNIVSKFIESVDFVFLSESIHMDIQGNNGLVYFGNFYEDEKPYLEEIEELYFVNDFDHSYTSITY